MIKGYSGLESRIGNQHYQFHNLSHEYSLKTSSPYRSGSEQIIAGILKRDDIRFSYEDELCVPREYTDGKSNRIWHPDFHLHYSGIIIEYVGMPDDEEYMKGIERKKEVYEKMDLPVVWLYPEDLWEQTEDKKYGKLRDDVEENVLSKIYEFVRESGRNAKPYSSVDVRALDYQSRQGAKAA